MKQPRIFFQQNVIPVGEIADLLGKSVVGLPERTAREIRSIKNCESLRALLLRHFKVLRHFSESFLAMKHAKRKIGIAARPNAGFAASA